MVSGLGEWIYRIELNEDLRSLGKKPFSVNTSISVLSTVFTM